MPHKNWSGLAVPTLSVETNDHTGGGINYGGLHPSSIAALLGKGPDVKKGERFDLKFNVNVSSFLGIVIHAPFDAAFRYSTNT